MSRIKHKDRIEQKRISFAPYNFVPLPEKVFLPEYSPSKPWERNDEFIEKTYSGYIEIEITAETPIYVRCGPPDDKLSSEDPKENPERQQFFHHGDPDKPVIPGSTIRGMVRTLVEILSFGKMQWFNDKRLIYRSVFGNDSLATKYQSSFTKRKIDTIEYPSANVRAGYLEIINNKKYIRPAKTINEHTFVHIPAELSIKTRDNTKNYDENDIKPFYIKPPDEPQVVNSHGIKLKLFLINDSSNISTTKKEGFEKVLVVRSGTMPNKKMHCAIYEPDGNAGLIEIPKEMWELYEEDCNMTRGIPTRKIKEKGDPLFYLLDDNGELVFFGPTMMFRIPYKSSIKEKIPEELRRPGDLDLAEAMFGTIKEVMDGGKKNIAIKGRVFFEDCIYEEGNSDIFYEPFYPKILSAPKPTCFQHYLVQTNDQKTKLNHWDSNTEIRGHKLYWHKPDISDKDIQENDQNAIERYRKQYTIIRPVKKGTKFKGKVHFDNLTELELGALLTALNLPEDKRHHIGMGKPLGMGSIKISPKLFLIDRKKRYKKLFNDQMKPELGLLEVDAETQKRCLKTFKEAIIEHCKKTGEIEIKNENQNIEIWDIPRLKTLNLLLKWDHKICKSKISYQNFSQFRDRKVLPTPQQVANLSSHNGSAPDGSGAPINPSRQNLRRYEPLNKNRRGRNGPPRRR